MNNIRDENYNTLRKFRKITMACFKNLYSIRLGNLQEMGKFQYVYDLPKLNSGELNNIKRFITMIEIKTLIKHSQLKMSRANEYITEFYQPFKEKLTAILLRILHKLETEIVFPNSFYNVVLS